MNKTSLSYGPCVTAMVEVLFNLILIQSSTCFHHHIRLTTLWRWGSAGRSSRHTVRGITVWRERHGQGTKLCVCRFTVTLPSLARYSHWHIDHPFVRPSEMMLCLTKGGNLHNVIAYIIWANQKTESIVYRWIHALVSFAIFDVTRFPTFVGASTSFLVLFLIDNHNSLYVKPLPSNNTKCWQSPIWYIIILKPLIG